MLTIRTVRPFWQSKPSMVLLILTLLMGIIAVLFPFLPIADWFGFVALPLPVLLALLAIVALYIVACELTKFLIFRKGARTSETMSEVAAVAHSQRNSKHQEHRPD